MSPWPSDNVQEYLPHMTKQKSPVKQRKYKISTC
jgi:hypothetical protein